MTLSRDIIRAAVNSMAALPRFAQPWRDWIKLVYIWLSRGTLLGPLWILGPFCLTSLGLEGIGSSSFTFDSLTAAYSDRGGFYGCFALLPSAMKVLDQAHLHLTLSWQLNRISVDSRAALPRFARPWRDWIKLVYIWLSRGSLLGTWWILWSVVSLRSVLK